MLRKFNARRIQKGGYVIESVSNGGIGMKESSTLITKFGPINGASLSPINPLLFQEVSQM
jgi:hypothetical protein